jgi:UDP-N-acetylmuramoyl-L-alanyl-D-glutamate--2,6-diaminopimelate ligase
VTAAELLRSLDADDPGGALASHARDQTVTSIEYDSRRVGRGAIFVALRGQRVDANTFADQALAQGAVAIVSEEPAPAAHGGVWVTVRDARAALAALAAASYGQPSAELRVVGVTGTNGKTTTAFLLHAVFGAAGIPCGLVGTVQYRIGDEEREASRTTPEAPDVQRMFRDMVDRGCGACVMEVSSHALAQRRVDKTRFAAGIFTNLTRDHLDFHGDMDAYFLAKRRLFEMLPADSPAVINLDDPRGGALIGAGGTPLTYAIDRDAQVRPVVTPAFSLRGLTFDINTPAGVVHVDSKLVGRPNVYNILAATAAATGLDLSVEVIEQGLANLTGVPGRFQIVSDKQDDVTVVVDYAHTDDALKNLLETARPLAERRLITVFGCGGDRDRTKRPLMGAVAVRLSDVVVITSDNPRSEDPQRIIDEIKRGIGPAPDASRPSSAKPGRAPLRSPVVLTLVDRREAIEQAVAIAEPGDVILIAGKGHEKTQVIGDRSLPFDDVGVAKRALGGRREAGGESAGREARGEREAKGAQGR